MFNVLQETSEDTGPHHQLPFLFIEKAFKHVLNDILTFLHHHCITLHIVFYPKSSKKIEFIISP